MRHLVIHPARLRGLAESHPLKRALHRARREGDAPPTPWACVLAAAGVGSALSLAALCARGEGLEGTGWLRLDPVALLPNREHLVMAGNAHLQLQPEEAAALAEALEAWSLFPGLCQPHPLRWYLPLEAPVAMETEPWAAVLGGDVRPALPRGAEARRWRARLAEAEMVLFEAPPNRLRRQRGRPTVDSLWLWGEGPLPQAATGFPWSWVAGEGILAKGLAAWAGVPWHSLQTLPGDVGLVVVDDGLAGPPPDAILEAGVVPVGVSFRVSVAGEGVWQIPPRRWWAFWRR